MNSFGIWMRLFQQLWHELLPLEPKSKWIYRWALIIATTGTLTAATLELTVGLMFTTYYAVAHFLFGLAGPYFFAVIHPSKLAFLVGIIFVGCSHLANELIIDLHDGKHIGVDIDQVASGFAGLLVSIIVFTRLIARHSESGAAWRY